MNENSKNNSNFASKITSAVVYQDNGKSVIFELRYIDQNGKEQKRLYTSEKASDDANYDADRIDIDEMARLYSNLGVKVICKEITKEKPIDVEKIENETTKLTLGKKIGAVVTIAAAIVGIVLLGTAKPNKNNPYNGQTISTPKITSIPTAIPTKSATPTATIAFGPSNTATVTPVVTPTPAPTALAQYFNPKDSATVLGVITDLEKQFAGNGISNEDYTTIVLAANGIYPSNKSAYLGKHLVEPMNIIAELDIPNISHYFNTHEKVKNGSVKVDTSKRTPITKFLNIFSNRKDRAYVEAYVNLREQLVDAVYKNDKTTAYKLVDQFYRLECRDFGEQKAISTTDGDIKYSDVSPVAQYSIILINSSINDIITNINRDYKVEYTSDGQKQEFEIGEIETDIAARMSDAGKEILKQANQGNSVECSNEVDQINRGLSK